MTLPETSRTWAKNEDRRTLDKEIHYVVLVSEKQARVLSLPSQTCPYKATLSETSFVVRADVVQIKTSGS